jgi:nucleotide-binding universal stress UspA family protein
MAKLAKAGRVRFDSLCDRPGTVYDGIIRAARRKKCDAIFMASHGRSGLAKLVMGSVTQKVLVQSKLPVLVYR